MPTPPPSQLSEICTPDELALKLTPLPANRFTRLWRCYHIKGYPEGDKARGNKANKELWARCKFFELGRCMRRSCADEMLLHGNPSATLGTTWRAVHCKCDAPSYEVWKMYTDVTFTYFSERTLSPERQHSSRAMIFIIKIFTVATSNRDVATSALIFHALPALTRNCGILSRIRAEL